MSTTWQWAKSNPDEAARQIRELERENAELRAHVERVGEANDRLVVENAALREGLAIEYERSLYWRNIAGRKEAQP